MSVQSGPINNAGMKLLPAPALMTSGEEQPNLEEEINKLEKEMKQNKRKIKKHKKQEKEKIPEIPVVSDVDTIDEEYLETLDNISYEDKQKTEKMIDRNRILEGINLLETLTLDENSSSKSQSNTYTDEEKNNTGDQMSFSMSGNEQTKGSKKIVSSYLPKKKGNRRVKQPVNKISLSDRNKNMVAALRSQIIDLWENEGFKKTGEDPYRLPARLAMLGHLMGMMPLFNCKSGKDRTGQMDVACKALALQMYERGGRLPPLDKPRTSMDEHIFQQVAINGGNLEMQRMNTGLAGFKTSGVEGLDRLFSESAREVHRGLSHYVEV